jgi:predicted DNA-binding transcriptional regulator AlpA
MIQEFLNTRDVSQLLGVSVSTIKRLRKTSSGPPWTRVGAQIRYHVHSVRDWAKANQNRHKRDMGV